MTLRFLAIVIALLLLIQLPTLRQWRDLRWFQRWIEQCGDARTLVRLLLVLAPPVLAVAVVAGLLGISWWTGLLWLAFAVLVLIYTLGPRHLESDIAAVLDAESRSEREQAAQAFKLQEDDDAAIALKAPELVEAAMLCARKQRFGVILWFLLLGPAGALLYRLAQVLGDHADTDTESRHYARRFAELLDWPVSHLMVFAMALVSKFDAVIHAWHTWHKAPIRSPWAFESGFLGPCARAAVCADIHEGDEDDTAEPAWAELIDARRLLQRMLLVWLAVIALLILAGWVT